MKKRFSRTMMFGIPYTNMYKIATHLEPKFSAIKNQKKTTAKAVILSLIFAVGRVNF